MAYLLKTYLFKKFLDVHEEKYLKVSKDLLTAAQGCYGHCQLQAYI